MDNCRCRRRHWPVLALGQRAELAALPLPSNNLYQLNKVLVLKKVLENNKICIYRWYKKKISRVLTLNQLNKAFSFKKTKHTFQCNKFCKIKVRGITQDMYLQVLQKNKI